MAVNLQTRKIESEKATELYISAAPSGNVSTKAQAEEVFAAVADMLRSENAFILQERVFATSEFAAGLCALRKKVYGDIDDGVAPCVLLSKEGGYGSLAGIQIHAIISDCRPVPITSEEISCGRILRLPGLQCLTLSGISAPQLSHATEQVQKILEKAETILNEFGTDFLAVPRTWMWLGDILSWYNDFNQIRNDFFEKRGVVTQNGRHSMPASTGIGLGPADGGKCSMDLMAVIEPKNSIQYLQAGGKQQSAFEYGSAFSRASKAITPAGETVFISGTASIDAAGKTTNLDDPKSQIEATIENVQAVLKEMDCSDENVVQVTAFCKTTQVEDVFNTLKNKISWPWITCICDICRSNLLFEIEATALKQN